MPERSDFKAVSKAAKRAEGRAAIYLRKPLAKQVAEIAEGLESGEELDSILARTEKAFENEMVELRYGLALQMGVDGWNLAGLLLGKTRLFGAQAKALRESLPDFFGADELASRHLSAGIREWIEETSKIESKTSAARWQRIVRKAMKGIEDPVTGQMKGATPKQMAAMFRKEAKRTTKARSEMMARTLSNWAYNEGSMKTYLNEGVQFGEWLATLDDVTGEWDAELHGTIYQLGSVIVHEGEYFVGADGSSITAGIDVMHPPLHPNCRCVLAPVV